MRIHVLALTLLTISSAAPPASAAYVTVYGGATVDYATDTGGATYDPVPGRFSIVGDGVAIGIINKYANGQYTGNTGVRWDASGRAATELGHLGADSNGIASSGASAVNSAGSAVGGSSKFAGATYIGKRAVRWDASGSAPTELGNLGTTTGNPNFPTTFCGAIGINGAGTAVGAAEKYVGGIDMGTRAVRWPASGTAAQELGNLGTASNGSTNTYANAMSSTGTVVGYAEKYTGGTFIGKRAVRWDGSGTAATELAGLNIEGFVGTETRAAAVNTAGTAVGFTYKVKVGVGVLGTRAVRWDASGTAATELGNLGISSVGFETSWPYAINSAGTAVGFADKYDASGVGMGTRAVRWDASGTAATELGNLDPTFDGYTTSQAFAINDAGAAVGHAIKIGGSAFNIGDRRAVLWNSDAVAIDLNTLIDPNSGWTLTAAFGISDTNWAAGVGQFDPDGDGPLGPYQRGFLMNVSSVVPEPSSLALLILALPALLLRRRRRSVHGDRFASRLREE